MSALVRIKIQGHAKLLFSVIPYKNEFQSYQKLMRRVYRKYLQISNLQKLPKLNEFNSRVTKMAIKTCHFCLTFICLTCFHQKLQLKTHQQKIYSLHGLFFLQAYTTGTPFFWVPSQFVVSRSSNSPDDTLKKWQFLFFVVNFTKKFYDQLFPNFLFTIYKTLAFA